jgi:hypothetical protein
MTFSPDEADNKVLILPLKNDFNIDWNFLRTIEKFKDAKLEPISDEKRKDFKFNVEEYKDAVVMPWYRNQVKHWLPAHFRNFVLNADFQPMKRCSSFSCDNLIAN